MTCKVCVTRHIVWIPKCHRKVLFGRIRKHLGDLFHSLAWQ